jgi:hypothetical protein
MFLLLIFYPRTIMKLDHYNDTFVEFCEPRFLMQPLQKPPLLSSTLFQENVHCSVRLEWILVTLDIGQALMLTLILYVL